uniref:Protein kinase domain-containing protein n=1 Tax=Setaria digitata TaxID=48799 RepID=A0A915PSS9_9BILA
MSAQVQDEMQLTDGNTKIDSPSLLPTMTDSQVTDAAYDFCQRLKARDLFFKRSQADGIEDRNVYPVYSKSGRRYIVKVSPGGSLEASLLLQLNGNTTGKYFHSAQPKVTANSQMNRTEKCYYQHPRQLCHPVNYLQDIYHGTICTANILVDHRMTGRLTGLTKAQEVANNMSKNMQLAMYAAPESVSPEAESLPQDMFAIGVVLYRCLVGRMPKRKPNGTIDYHGVKSSIAVPLDPKMWRTTQLLMSERLEMRLTAGQLLHTGWIETAATTPITQLFNWNN